MNQLGKKEIDAEVQEIKKQQKSYLKLIADVFRGDFLSKLNVNFVSLIVVVFFVFIYIFLKYRVDMLAKEEIKLKEENKKLHNKQVTLTFELIKASQRSNVEKQLKKYNINIKSPQTPPYVIKIDGND